MVIVLVVQLIVSHILDLFNVKSLFGNAIANHNTKTMGKYDLPSSNIF